MVLLLIALVVCRSQSVGSDTADYIRDISSGEYNFSLQNTISYYTGGDALSVNSSSTVAAREFVFASIVSFLIWLGFPPFFAMKLINIGIILMCYKSLKIFLPSKYVYYGVLLYVISFLYYTQFNTLRQSLAVSLFFLSIAFFYRGHKYDRIKSVVICLLALFSHTTTLVALLLLPLSFIIYEQKRRIKTMALVLFFLLLVEAFDNQMGILNGFFDKLTAMKLIYSNQLENYSITGFSMSSIEKFFTLIFHGILVVLFLWSVKEKKEKKYVVFENIWFVGLALFILLAKSPIFARVVEYFLLFQTVAIPIAIKTSKDNCSFNSWKKWLVSFCLFITYWYYLQAHWYGIIPYELNF